MRYEGGLNLFEQGFDRRLEASRFRRRLLRHLGVVGIDQFAGFRELLLVLLQPGTHLYQRLEVSQFPAQGSHELLVPYFLRIGELSLYLRGPLDGVPEPVAETQLSVAGAAAGLPYF